MRSQRTRLFGCAATVRDAKAALLWNERDTTPVGSWAPVVGMCPRTTACNHLPTSGMVHASALKFGFHLVQFSSAVSCGSFAQHRKPSIALFFTHICG